MSPSTWATVGQFVLELVVFGLFVVVLCFWLPAVVAAFAAG